jgi:hypothetical protein
LFDHLIMIAVAVYTLARAVTHSRGWRAAFREAGITDVVKFTSVGMTTGLGGRCGPLPVEIRQGGPGEESQATVFRVQGLAGVVLRPEPRHRGTSTPYDAETGDAAFDREVEIGGPDALVRAVLDEPTRAVVRRLMRGPFKVEVAHGAMELVLREPVLRRWRQSLAGSLCLALEAARRLVPPDDPLARLLHNVRHDPEAGVRARCLATMAR